MGEGEREGLVGARRRGCRRRERDLDFGGLEKMVLEEEGKAVVGGGAKWNVGAGEAMVGGGEEEVPGARCRCSSSASVAASSVSSTYSASGTFSAPARITSVFVSNSSSNSGSAPGAVEARREMRVIASSMAKGKVAGSPSASVGCTR